MPRILVADKIAEARIERLRSTPWGLDQAMPDDLRNTLSATNPPILSVRTVSLPFVANGPSAP
jgi:hypothetical protein